MLSEQFIAHSRQALMLGTSSYRHLESSRVLIVGPDHLGYEVGKNIVLAGVGTVCIHKDVSGLPLNLGVRSGIGFLSEEGVSNENIRIHEIISRLEAIKSPSQVVSEHKEELTEDEISKFTAVVFINVPLGSDLTISYNEISRKRQVKFIAAEIRGLIGVFCSDFGQHTYKPSATEPVTKPVVNISCDKSPIVTVGDEDHELYSDDTVEFYEVSNMTELNNKSYKVDVIDRKKFKIDFDTSHYKSPATGGFVKVIQMNQKIECKSLKELLSMNFRAPWQKQLREGFGCLWSFFDKFNQLPRPHSQEDADTLLKFAPSNITEEQQKFLKTISYQAAACLSPMATLFGGLVGQEVLKACLDTFKPVGITLFSSLDCLPINFLEEEDQEFLPETETRYKGQIWCFGKKLQNELEKRKVFLIGTGALGCEFLKLFATMGIACSKEGKVYATDPDCISLSNLHRQFLFSPSDIGKFKVEVATERSVEINPLFNVTSYKLEVNDKTAIVYSDLFWENLDEVVGAVDSVSAREFIDQKCQFYNLPFLESGTLGLKCSSNTHLPGLTTPYEGQPDPEAEIACSGKQFPFRPMHTIGWANDYFQAIWHDQANAYKSYLEHKEENQNDPNFLSWMKNNKIDVWQKLHHGSINDHKQFALDLLKIWIVDNPTQCITEHPKDEVDENGVLFWSGTKLFPVPVPINPDDPLQNQFVESCLKLMEKIFSPDGTINLQDFEKDDPYHIEFIYTTSNLISQVYHIPPQTRAQVHQISGRIFAASLTTTAAIVGLVCLEYYKVVQREDLVNRLKQCQVDSGNNNLLARVTVEKAPSIVPPRWMVVDLHRDLLVSELYKYILDKFYIKPNIITFKNYSSQIPLESTDSKTVSELIKQELGRLFQKEYSGSDRYWFLLEADCGSEFYNIKYRFK